MISSGPEGCGCGQHGTSHWAPGWREGGFTQVEDKPVQCLQNAWLSGLAWGQPSCWLALGLGPARSWGCLEQRHPPSCHFSLLFCRNSEPYIFSFVLPLLAGGMTVSIGLRRNERVSHSVPAASARVPSVSPRGEGRLGQALVRGLLASRPAAVASGCCWGRQDSSLGLRCSAGRPGSVSHSPAASPTLPTRLYCSSWPSTLTESSSEQTVSLR